MKPINIHEAKAEPKPVKTGGLRIPGGVPEDFDMMFAEEIEALFSASPARRAACPGLPDPR